MLLFEITKSMLTCYSEIETFTRNACKEIFKFGEAYNQANTKSRTVKRRFERFVIATRAELKKNIRTQLAEMKKEAERVAKWTDFSSENFKTKYAENHPIASADKQFADVWAERHVSETAKTAINDQSKLMANYDHLCAAMMHIEKHAQKALEAMV